MEKEIFKNNIIFLKNYILFFSKFINLETFKIILSLSFNLIIDYVII